MTKQEEKHMWTRVSDIDRMLGAMDLFRSRMNGVLAGQDTPYTRRTWRVADAIPNTTLFDTGNQLELKAEVPGFSKEDLNIRIQGNYLELSGSRKQNGPEGYKTHRLERENTSFTRSFTLPTDVDGEKVEAHLNNGILTLTLPKSEAAKPRQIDIS